MGKFGVQALNYSGLSKKDRLLYSKTLSFTFFTAVEVFDGFLEELGFSWGDFTANAVGSGLYIVPELLHKEQRIVMKYSFHCTKYASQRPDKLGDGFFEEFLKDYNGQTNWLSANMQVFFKNS